MEVGINPTEGIFSIDVSWKFLVFTKILTSENCEQPSYSFSIEKFMLRFLGDEYLSNLSAWSGE